MSNIIQFQFDTAQVRVMQDETGEPWFVAKDVCDVLGIRTDTIRSILDEDEVTTINPNTIGVAPGGRDILIISESGLYSIVLRSRKPEAKPFRKWVTSDVLPSIRKHGGYMTPEKIEEAILNPDTIIRLATDLKAEREKRAAIQAERDRLKPKAETMDALMATDTALPIGSVAKALHKDFGIGRNRLFRFLRDRGVLLANNEPRQEFMERGYFRVVERRFEVAGEMKVGTQTLVYQKGVNYIAKLLRDEPGKAA